MEAVTEKTENDIQLSEETIQRIVEVFNNQITFYEEYNTKLVDTIRESACYSENNKEGKEILKFIDDNFKISVDTLNKNIKSITEPRNN